LREAVTQCILAINVTESPESVVTPLQHTQHKYAVAQIEHMKDTIKHIRYTPTFAIYRNGRKVDEVVGKEPQRLADHLWLHHD